MQAMHINQTTETEKIYDRMSGRKCGRIVGSSRKLMAATNQKCKFMFQNNVTPPQSLKILQNYGLYVVRTDGMIYGGGMTPNDGPLGEDRIRIPKADREGDVVPWTAELGI